MTGALERAKTPPAGWYPDPTVYGMQRWWDGAQWTAHAAPLAPQMQVQVPPRIVVRTPRVNHVLHFTLTILTFGLWLPVWIIVAIAN